MGKLKQKIKENVKDEIAAFAILGAIIITFAITIGTFEYIKYTKVAKTNADLEINETQEENKAVTNYETLENKVNNYEKKESREAKNKILSQEVYSALIDTDEFKELKSKIDEYTVEEIQDKVDLLLAHYIKKGEFSFNGTNNTIKLSLKDEEKEKKPYGTLFK